MRTKGDPNKAIIVVRSGGPGSPEIMLDDEPREDVRTLCARMIDFAERLPCDRELIELYGLQAALDALLVIQPFDDDDGRPEREVLYEIGRFFMSSEEREILERLRIRTCDRIRNIADSAVNIVRGG